MKKITTVVELKAAILELEIKQANEGRALKEQFNVIQDNLKPINLIKNTFKEVTTSSSVRGSVLTNVMGLGLGYLAKKVLFGGAPTQVTKIAGTLLQMGIAGGASGIKSVGTNLLKRFFNRRQKKKVASDHIDEINSATEK